MPLQPSKEPGETFDFERFYGHVLDQFVDGVYIVDTQRVIRYWNHQAEQLSGYSAGEMIGRCCADNLLCHVDDCGRCLCLDGCPMQAAMSDGQERHVEAFLRHKDGHRVPVHIRVHILLDVHGRTVGCIHYFRANAALVSASPQHRMPTDRSMVDPLTNLPDRHYLERELGWCFDQLHRNGRSFGLILTDIDYFRRFNDCYGHPQGDCMLQLVADTLSHACRQDDMPFRWSDDELLILTRCAQADNLARIAERFRSLVAHSKFSDGGRDLCVSLSAGATLAHLQDTPSTLIHRATMLLAQSKRAGRNCVTCDQPPQTQAA